MLLDGLGATRDRLLTLVADELVPAALVHGLDTGDLEGYMGCTNATLRAFLRAVEPSERMDAGLVPGTYTVATRCPECGPVWLPEPLPSAALSCPWCFRRRAGRSFPRPPAGSLVADPGEATLLAMTETWP